MHHDSRTVRKSPNIGSLPSRSLGPIADLERHLPADWWRKLFNSLYLKTDGDVVEHDQATQSEIDAILSIADLKPEHRILDLCCGQGRHSLELAKRGFKDVTGIDRSRYLIRLARKRAQKAGWPVSFHEGDARRFRTKGDKFDAVLMLGNSFGYFESKADDESLVRNVMKLLKPSGTLVMDLIDGAWMRQHYEPRSWEWIDQDYFVCRERDLAKDGQRLVSREVITHVNRGVVADQFYAERLYSQEEIEALLTHSGFSQVQCHGTLLSLSTRDQDLGMMSRRLLFTSKAPDTIRVEPKRGLRWHKITVVMGDPQLPDKVKPEQQFGPDDFATIERLQSALADIPGVETMYVKEHTTLISSLMDHRPDFVLNLCDEGYRNDALKELHVPALLEMLDIPYTGAGPACLAMCYNKNLVNALCQSLDIPVPLESYLGEQDLAATIPATFPAILKPNFGDSSVGITKDAVVWDMSGLIRYIEKLHAQFGKIPILLQEFLVGKEYSVGVIGNPSRTMEVLPPLEVDYSLLPQELPRILGYESKWYLTSPYCRDIRYVPAKLTEEDYRLLFDYSNKLFERLGCRDYARFDFRADAQGRIKLLEVNPNPGWCWDGKLAMMAEFKGYSYAKLLHKIIEASQERYGS